VSALPRWLVGSGALALLLAALPARSESSVYAGLELGNTDTRRVDAGASVLWRESWSAGIQLARADFELPDAAMISTLGSARLSYDFGTFGIGLGARRGEIEGVVATNGWFANVFMDRDDLRLSVEVESRNSDLESGPFVEDLGTGAGVQSGISRCSMDSMGYQAQLNLDRSSWSGFLSYRFIDYDDFDCTLTLAADPGGPPAHARGQALGRLGRRPLQAVEGFASRLIPREAVFLESSVALGAAVPVGNRWLGGVELYHDQEQCSGDAYDTALAFGVFQLTETWSVELSVGYSDATVVEDTAFTGVRVFASL
jgi:hypothetical protein